MVNKCAAAGCKSGYDKTEESSGVKVSFHAFPLNNKDMCDKWIRANPRKDFVPSKHSKLCSLHFKPSDFVEIRRDSNKQRMKTYADGQLSCRYLKDDDVPSVFPNTPSYLSNSGGTPRSMKRITAASRREHQAQEFKNLAETFMSEDNISHLDVTPLGNRLRAETVLPSGFTILSVSPTVLLICTLDISNNVPRIKASITVHSDLSVLVAVEDKVDPVSQYTDIVDGPLK